MVLLLIISNVLPSAVMVNGLKALKIREDTLGDDYPATGTIYNNLALLYKSMNQYKKAVDFNLKAIEISEKTLENKLIYTFFSIMFENNSKIN